MRELYKSLLFSGTGIFSRFRWFAINSYMGYQEYDSKNKIEFTGSPNFFYAIALRILFGIGCLILGLYIIPDIKFIPVKIIKFILVIFIPSLLVFSFIYLENGFLHLQKMVLSHGNMKITRINGKAINYNKEDLLNCLISFKIEKEFTLIRFVNRNYKSVFTLQTDWNNGNKHSFKKVLKIANTLGITQGYVLKIAKNHFEFTFLEDDGISLTTDISEKKILKLSKLLPQFPLIDSNCKIGSYHIDQEGNNFAIDYKMNAQEWVSSLFYVAAAIAIVIALMYKETFTSLDLSSRIFFWCIGTVTSLFLLTFGLKKIIEQFSKRVEIRKDLKVLAIRKLNFRWQEIPFQELDKASFKIETIKSEKQDNINYRGYTTLKLRNTKEIELFEINSTGRSDIEYAKTEITRTAKIIAQFINNQLPGNKLA